MIFLAIWIALFLFPPVVRGPRATHTAIRITRPEGPINRDGSTTAYAHVQEKGEFRLHKLLAILAGIPFLLLPITPEIVSLMLQPIVMMAVDQFTRKINAIDYAGHGAEILFAEENGDTEYRAKEIKRMSDDHDKKGQDIAGNLLKWEWLSRIVLFLGRK